MKTLVFILSDTPNIWLMLTGAILIVLAIIIIVKTTKKKVIEKGTVKDEGMYQEKDVLGLEKPAATNTESFTILGRVITWKVVFLIALMLLGLYLIYSNRPNFSGYHGNNDQNNELKKSDK